MTAPRWMVRQGDVLLIEDDAIPTQAVPVPTDAGRVVLAYGEVTGHAHAILTDDVELLSTAEHADRWLRVTGGTPLLVHEEHAAQEILRPIVRVVRQREYSPEAIRNVAD